MIRKRIRFENHERNYKLVAFTLNTVDNIVKLVKLNERRRISSYGKAYCNIAG